MRMPGSRPTSSRPGSRPVSAASIRPGSRPASAARPWLEPPTKLPREGREGGGTVCVADAELLSKVIELVSREEHDEPQVCHDMSYFSPGSERSVLAGQPALANTATTLRQASTGYGEGKVEPDWTPAENTKRYGARAVAEVQRARSMAELRERKKQMDDLREQDLATMQTRLANAKQLREQRFQRMFKEVTNKTTGPRAKASRDIQNWQALNERKQLEVYRAWDELVFEPMAQQAEGYMNDYRKQAQKLCGQKSVDFRMPGATAKVYYNALKDPMKAQLVEKAREDQIGYEILGAVYGVQRSHSAPQLELMEDVKAWRSRPVLEPTVWNPVKLEGTACCGRLSRAAEHGSDFPRLKKGGHSAHLPDETDGISTAGKTILRPSGRKKLHNHMGTLEGDFAIRGAGAQTKTNWGASHAAPAQDHFMFERGSNVVDAEFPLGKRTFSGFP
eukprot:TRINITY_DN121160_c0_g1_i1.p1 TRINITY_DN121160_c0_g1~~TRINITY_DN121160_c0_g1_i1.p1  ORF type:complete len:448 (-),score=65.92 TRINITY_DN121160_c0_g1_i1:328-1671(-)